MRWISLVAAVLIVSTGCSTKKTEVTGEGDKKLSLTRPETVTIKQGETKQITVEIKREKFDDPVDIKFTNLPDGVTIKDATTRIDKGATKATFTLEATPKAAVQKGATAKISASGGGMTNGPHEFTINVDEKK